MMVRLVTWRMRAVPWLASALTAAWAVLVAVEPAPLRPLADVYRAVCEEHPPLALVTHHTSPGVVAFLASLGAVAALHGGRVMAATLLGSVRFHRRLERERLAPPPRLVCLGRALRLNGRLTYLPQPDLVALCYGFLRPRIAVSARLLTSLDNKQLSAVLVHEREHLRRRDPARYLALRAMDATAFMFPLAAALRQCLEARIELNADRTAIAAVGREALAGALLTTLLAPRPATGAVGLSATEARIAYLTGATALPSIPMAAVAASAGLAALIALAATRLATSTDMMRMICQFCANLT